ncbi:unannotated protein [freshwater metagenome]|uniref:Unannotated protein n=1 Tax=freshwater metagenome TaxID=449393 RepID=A0A6J6IPJ9_9ZZZZ
MVSPTSSRLIFQSRSILGSSEAGKSALSMRLRMSKGVKMLSAPLMMTIAETMLKPTLWGLKRAITRGMVPGGNAEVSGSVSGPINDRGPPLDGRAPMGWLIRFRVFRMAKQRPLRQASR